MTFRWLDRWGPLAGALGVMSFVIAILLYGNGPKDDDQKIVAYFAKDAHQTKYLVAFYFFFAAFLLMLVFLTALRALLIEAEGEPGRLTALAFAGGVASAVLLLAANAFFAAPAITAKDSDKFKLDPNTYRFIRLSRLGPFMPIFAVSTRKTNVVLLSKFSGAPASFETISPRSE